MLHSGLGYKTVQEAKFDRRHFTGVMAQSVDSVLSFCRAHAFTFLTVSYLLFIILGGCVFMILEQQEENLLMAEVHHLREKFLENNACIQEQNLRDLLREVLYAGKRGVAALKSDSDEYNFDFTSSLFFVTTFLTTTGYGTTIPLSDEGRVFCMLYCLFGIPLTLLLLSCLTKSLLPLVTRTPIHYIHLYWGQSHNAAALLYCCVLASCTALLFFLLPALALCLMESDWSFLESLYFCFISLSTIGLGDYLPGKTHSQAARQWLEFATSCYLVLGLVVLLVVLESFWELQQVQGMVRLFVGPRWSELSGFGLDELELSGEHSVHTQAQYTLPISTISHTFTETPTTPTGEETFTLKQLHMAGYKAASPSLHPDAIPEPPNQNN